MRSSFFGLACVFFAGCVVNGTDTAVQSSADAQGPRREFVLVESGLGGRTPSCTASEGPGKIWAGLSTNENWSDVAFARHVVPPVIGDLSLITDPQEKYLAQADQIFQLQQDVASKVYDATQSTNASKTTVVLSGAHTTAVGTMAGIWQAHRSARIGMVWIDAHADINTPFTSWSGNPHGMPVAAMASLDARSTPPAYWTINEADPKWPQVTEKWGDYHTKLLNGDSLRLEDLVYVSARDLDEAERYFLDLKEEQPNLGISNVEVASLQDGSDNPVDAWIQAQVSLIATKLASCDYVAINIDLDALDSKYVQGVGTPVPQGLSPETLKRLTAALIRSFGTKTIVVEITETDPVLDTGHDVHELKGKTLEYAIEIANIVHSTLTLVGR